MSPRLALGLLLGAGLLVPTLLHTAPPEAARPAPLSEALARAGTLEQAEAAAAALASGTPAATTAGRAAPGTAAAGTAAAAGAVDPALALAAAEDHVLGPAIALRDHSRSGRRRQGDRRDPRPSRPVARSRDQAMAAALDLMNRFPLIDGHNDMPWKLRELAGGRLEDVDLGEAPDGLDLQTDLNRLRRGRVGAEFWSAYVPAELDPQEAVVQTLQQIDLIRRLVDRHPGVLELATSAEDVERIFHEGRIASLIGVEGGQSLGEGDGCLAVLRQLHNLGVSYLTLTHNASLDWADAATDAPRCGGLSPRGVAIVKQMNRLGMLVDLSHVSVATMHAVLDASEAPVIFSHSSARALVDHPRNVPDEVLARLWTNGGLVMVTFVGPFVSPAAMGWWRQYEAIERDLGARNPGHPEAVEADLAAWTAEHPRPRATVEQVADHIVHIARVAGVDHVGIGSDFDGMGDCPIGLDDVSCLPNLVAELLRRGFSEDEVAAIMGGNLLRVMRDVERVSQGLAPLPPKLQGHDRQERHPAGHELDIDEIEDLDPFTEKPFALLAPRAGATG